MVPETEFIGYFGTVMIVHSGPSLTGIAWWWQEKHWRCLRYSIVLFSMSPSESRRLSDTYTKR